MNQLSMSGGISCEIQGVFPFEAANLRFFRQASCLVVRWPCHFGYLMVLENY